MCIPIYTQTLVIDVNVHYDRILFVDRVEFSRSTSLPHVPSVSTVVEASHYPGILTSHLPKSSELCNVHTLTLENDVVFHYNIILFVDSVEFSKSTSLPHFTYVFTVVDTSHYPAKLTSHIHKSVYNVRLHSDKVTCISSANTNNNSVLQITKFNHVPLTTGLPLTTYCLHDAGHNCVLQSA